jgi:hypothetical protein
MDVPTKDLEGRVRSIEKIMWTATGALSMLAVWVGAETLFYIPAAINKIPTTVAAQEAVDKINGLLQSAQDSSHQITQLEKNGTTILIGGVCFRPRVIYRCGLNDHHVPLTWIENATECGGNIEGRYTVLAQCSNNFGPQ